MRKRRDVFDRFDRETGLRERGDRHIATAARAFDANVDFFHTELFGFVGGLLRGHLTGERGALAAPFESAGTRGSPTKRVAFHVGDRHVSVVETNFDVSDAAGDISLNLTFFRNLSHSSISKNSLDRRDFRSTALGEKHYAL